MPEITQTLRVEGRAEWRAWLAAHHRTAADVWLVSPRRHTGRARLPHNDAVEEALCFGWIDSTRKSLDDDHTARRFSPRRPGVPYSQPNRERLRRMMEPAWWRRRAAACSSAMASNRTTEVPSLARPMRRVLVIGSGGAGKSTVARRLAAAAGLPLIHLDAHYWHPGWVPTPRDEWARTVGGLAAGERWVMDGNYGGTMDLRLAAADTVVFLDLPRTLCLWRAVRRAVRFRGRSRPDMRAGCPERMTWEFARWIWEYPRRRRPELLRRLAALGDGTRVVRLRSRGEVERFLRALEP